MPRVRITHATEYRYARQVRFTTHRLMLRPRDSHDLRLLSATMSLMPPAATTRWSHDVFGNSVCTLDWDEMQAASTLRVISRLDLEHFPAAIDLPHDSLDPVATTYPFSYASEEFPDLARLMERHHPDPNRQVDAWARRFLRRGAPTPTLDLLATMTQAIKTEFRYAARDAQGTNPPVATLRTGQGACRDVVAVVQDEQP